MGSKMIAGGISVGFSFSNQPFRTFGDDCTKNAPGRHNFWLDLGIYGQSISIQLLAQLDCTALRLPSSSSWCWRKASRPPSHQPQLQAPPCGPSQTILHRRSSLKLQILWHFVVCKSKGAGKHSTTI